MLRTDTEHNRMCLRAEKWLQQQNCKVILREPFRCPTNREQPDAIGWRDGISILLEVKVNRSDFLKDKKKPFRNGKHPGMGDWRFYMCPPDVIKVSDLPPGWGLLYVTPKLIRKIHGVPPNTNWHRKKPFTGNKHDENKLLVSAMRRFFVRGLGETVYMPRGETL